MSHKVKYIPIILFVLLLSLFVSACDSTTSTQPFPPFDKTSTTSSLSNTTTTSTYTTTTVSTSTTTSTTTATTTTATTTTTTTTPIPNVKITYIFYDGLVYRSESDEYVEITNFENHPVDLTSWKLKDISEGYPTFTFPSFEIQPNQKIRVYTNEIHLQYGGFSFGYGKAIWNNTNPDIAALFDAQGREVSRKSY